MNESLSFREIVEFDFDLIYSIFSNDDVMRYTIFETCKTETEFKAVFDDMLRRNQNEPREGYEYAVFAGNHFIGIGILEVSNKNAWGGCGEIGYLLMPEYWGKGYATSIAQKLLQIGFGDVGLHRICALCNEKNAASEKVMKKLGMIKEGELRKKRFKFGQWHNELCYAILASEWRKEL